jgi:glycine betaine/proline transport system substrate-binding protein
MTLKGSADRLSLGPCGAGANQAAGWCAMSGKPVKFAGLNWESGMLLTEVMQFVLKWLRL